MPWSSFSECWVLSQLFHSPLSLSSSESEVAQLCPTLSDPMDCSPPGSSIHGIFQARVLEWGVTAKRFFSSSSLCAIRVVSSAYLILLIFLLAILIPACASSSPAFLMMYSAYKLNKQGDNIQPWCTPFPIWKLCCSMCSSNCCFLTYIQISQDAWKNSYYCELNDNIIDVDGRCLNKLT